MRAGDLVHLLQRAAQAQRIEQEARETYQGGSWGYHGASLIEDVAKAEKALEDALYAFVDARVKIVLAR